MQKEEENDVLDLKSFIKQHPELVKSKQAFYSGLVDMYPNEKRAAKLIVIVYESGIAKKIAKAEQLDEITVRPLIIQLTEDYFIKEQYALDGIRYWAECFGKKLTYTIDSSMQTVPVQKASPTFEPKTVPIQQNIPNSNIPHQIVSDNKDYQSETNDATYYGIYKDMAYTKTTNEDGFHRAFEIACSIVANLFLKNHEDFFDNHLMGARAAFALVGLLGDETTKQEYSFVSEKYFGNNFFTAAQILKPEIDEWIRESYHSTDIYALALDAVASYLTIKKFPDSYGETLMFIKELKNLESKGFSSYECGVIVAYIVLTTGQLVSLFEQKNNDEEIYQYAILLFKNAKQKEDFYNAIDLLRPIKDYKNSREIIDACNQMIAQLDLRASKESAEGFGKRSKSAVQKYCYSFKEGNSGMCELLGEKGANLAEMTGLGLPVPFGFTISTEACAQYYEDSKTINDAIMAEIMSYVRIIEEENGKALGSKINPLLVSVRSGARANMPGLMNTILNLGLNDEIVAAMITFNPDPAFERFVYDSYRRFIQTFSVAVIGSDVNEYFDKLVDDLKKNKGIKYDTGLSAADLKYLAIQFKGEYKRRVGRELPADPIQQLKLAVESAFRSWDSSRANTYRINNSIPYSWGLAVSIMPMVFGNLNNQSGTGAAFTRDPATGEKKLMGEFLINAQGNEVIFGSRIPMPIAQMEQEFPEAYAEFIKVCDILENHYHDMQDIEFTVENKKLYMLQCGNGKRTDQAAITIACNLVDEGAIDEKTAASMVGSHRIGTLLKPKFDPNELKSAHLIGKGLGASPGVACGKVVFTADDAETWNARGENVILVCHETTLEDITGMKASQGILTVRGGMLSNAAEVARNICICCVSGCGDINLDVKNKKFTLAGKTFNEGDYISIDGFTGNVYEGIVHTGLFISEELRRVMEWIDKYEVKN